MLSDAPAHHLFCLLGPLSSTASASTSKPVHEVFCVLQVCLEGEISNASIMQGLSRGQRASGDLIPWTIGQQFLDQEFPRLSGARVIRIATHTDYQGMGYGSRALDLLEKYYEHQMVNVDESNDGQSYEQSKEGLTIVNEDTVGSLKELSKPKKLRLLWKLNERKAERLDYLGVSFGLTGSLLKFWKKAGFVPVYLRYCHCYYGFYFHCLHKLSSVLFFIWQTNSKWPDRRTFLHHVEGIEPPADRRAGSNS